LDAKLTPIENVSKEMNKLEAYYKCNATEQTDLTVPIRASLEILGNPENLPKDKYGTRRFILLVTGNGEFKPCSSELLTKANQDDDGIYIVGLDIKENSELNKYLSEMAYKGTNPKLTPSGLFPGEDLGSRYLNIPTNLQKNLNKSLEDALLEHFENIMNKTVAYDTVITEQLYCYQNSDLTSLEVTSNKGNSVSANINSNSINDGTTEIKINVPVLLPNSTTTVAFNIVNTFNPADLPITVSETDGPLTICSPIKRPKPSLDYIWFNWAGKNITLNPPDRRLMGTRLSVQSSDLYK
jgi:hypothetical protein